MKYHQWYGKQRKSMTYSSDVAISYITRIDRWIKSCIILFPEKGDLGIAKNYKCITLTSIVVKIYKTQLLNRIEPEIEKILWKNQNDFRRNRYTTSQILTIRRINIYIYIYINEEMLPIYIYIYIGSISSLI